MAFNAKIPDKSTPDGKKRSKKFYTCMIYTVKDGYMVNMVLRMPTWMKEEGWQETAEQIIDSYKVKK